MNRQVSCPAHPHRAPFRAWAPASVLIALVLSILFSIPLSAADEPAKGGAKAEKSEDSDKPEKPKEFEHDLGLPRIQDMELPSAEELLRNKPVDWVILKSSEVLIVELVSPRPDTLQRLNADYERYQKARAPFAEGEERLREKRRTLQRLQVTLASAVPNEDPDYLVETKIVQKIEYYEDLLLRRAALLIEEGKVPLAYDLLLIVDRRFRDNNVRMTEANEARKKEEAAARTNEDERVRYNVPEPATFRLPKTWPKFEETYQSLLAKDGELHASRLDFENATRLYENLWDHNPNYPGLSDRLGAAVDQLIDTSVQQTDFRKARFFLNRLAARDGQNPVVAKWRSQLQERTQAMIADARAASTQGNARLASSIINDAARVWPDTSGLKEVHRELTERYQSVRLGVLRLPGEPHEYPLEPTAEAEATALTSQFLFEPVRVDERGVKYRSAFFESWEPADLGRQMQFNLREKRADWESRAVITSVDILDELRRKIDPTLPTYDERLAGVVEQVSVQSPTQLTIHFRRLPLRLEALFQFPVSLTEESKSLNQDIQPEAVAFAGRQRFFETGRDPKSVTYQRVRPQSVTLKNRNIDEIVEVRFDSWDRLLQGLMRGELAGAPHVGLRDLRGLQDDNRFLVVPYALPVSHFLLCNPLSLPLRDGQLRRALTLAIPRDELLKQFILDGVSEPVARLTATPFPTSGYGHNRLLTEPDFDPQRAANLALAAKKQAGDRFRNLRILSPPDPVIRQIVATMIERWKLVGITVELVDNTEGLRDNDWDLIYRATTIVEPLTEVWPLLTLEPDAKVESLRPLPERVRHQLLELERSNEWTTATKLLRRVETELLIEARYMPLWEVDDFFVTRRNLVGLPNRMMHAFHGVERWTLQSWYPQEAP